MPSPTFVVVCLSATVVPAAGAPVAATSPANERIGIDSGRLRIEFSGRGSRPALVSLCGPEGYEWALPAPADTSLWRLELSGPQGRSETLSSGGLPPADAKSDAGEVRFTWNVPVGQGAAQIRLAVRCAPSSPLSCWSLQARVPEGWVVSRAEWPILANIRREAGLRMAAPFGWGLEYEVSPGMSYAGTYPSLVWAMPFVAFYRGTAGLYVGVHDPEGHHKHVSVKAAQNDLTLVLTHWPAAADTAGGVYAPGFEPVVGVFEGGYYEAAQIYRAFSLRAPWGKAPPVSKRPIPGWLKDIDLWLMPGPEPLKNVEACRRAGEFFGVPIALHWYNWHEIPFDTLYPEYFPPKPNFREGVKALQQAGFRVMPYINGRLCDPNSKTWKQEGAERSAARQPDGKPYTEVYGSKVPLNVMCPATPQWREKVASIVDRLITEYGVDGVYIDQISAAHAVRCFAADHGHSPGGGRFWVDGYRRMLEEIRSRLPPDRILTSEENAECWNDQFDALLLVNTPASSRRVIPLMPAVYSGRVLTFGFQYIAGDDATKSLPFRAKMARAFIWGAQLGWVGVDTILGDAVRAEAEFLRSLARCRRFGHEFVVTGRFLGELRISGDNPPMTIEGAATSGSRYTFELPAVLASAWLAESGDLGVLLVNQSNEPRTVEVELPLEAANIPRGSPAPQTVIGPDGPLDTQPVSGATRKLTIPPRDARILRVAAGNSP